MSDTPGNTPPGITPPMNEYVYDDETTMDTLPIKSKMAYWSAYRAFMAFCNSDFSKSAPSEKELTTYIRHLREVKNYHRSSLWRVYSILNTIIKSKWGWSLVAFPRLKCYIGNISSQDETKKAAIFSRQEMEELVQIGLSTESMQTLTDIVIGVVMYQGGLRSYEGFSLSRSSFKKTHDGSYVVFFNRTKKRKRSDARMNRFIISNTRQTKWASLLTRYLEKVDNCSAYFGKGGSQPARVWRRINPSGKFANGSMGKQRYQNAAMNCCRHLGKPSTAATSHSWRRSSCTVMANAGTTSEVLCQFYGWQSHSMVKEYVTNSTSALVSASSALNGSPQATESTRQLSMQVERMIIEDSDDDFQCEEPASLGSAVKQDFPAIVASYGFTHIGDQTPAVVDVDSNSSGVLLPGSSSGNIPAVSGEGVDSDRSGLDEDSDSSGVDADSDMSASGGMPVLLGSNSGNIPAVSGEGVDYDRSGGDVDSVSSGVDADSDMSASGGMTVLLPGSNSGNIPAGSKDEQSVAQVRNILASTPLPKRSRLSRRNQAIWKAIDALQHLLITDKEDDKAVQEETKADHQYTQDVQQDDKADRKDVQKDVIQQFKFFKKADI